MIVITKITCAQSLKPVSNNCSIPTPLVLTSNTFYGFTESPNGPNASVFLPQNLKKDKYWFEKEHNTAWYALSVKDSGIMEFTIFSVVDNQDNDFLLFKVDSFKVCDQIKSGKLLPIRTNISRNKNELKDLTGLNNSSKSEFVNRGLNDAFSKSVTVNKGEKYILVIDNVNENPSGHKLLFKIGKPFKISGIVKDDNDQILPSASVVISDKGGNEIETTITNNKGEYTINTILKEGKSYNVISYHDSAFIENKSITVKSANEISLNVVLNKLKKKKKYKFKKILFVGGQSVLIPESHSSADALYQLMKRNKKLVIRIEGHVNGYSNGKEHGYQLSLDRAKTINDFLVKKGIDQNRISYIGKGASEMLYPETSVEELAQENRRIEIVVLEY